MFSRTSVGASAPVLLVNDPLNGQTPRQSRIAPRTVGLTLETVSRCFGALKRSRLIAFDHPEIITIRDRRALEALAAGNAHASAA